MTLWGTPVLSKQKNNARESIKERARNKLLKCVVDVPVTTPFFQGKGLQVIKLLLEDYTQCQN